MLVLNMTTTDVVMTWKSGDTAVWSVVFQSGDQLLVKFQRKTNLPLVYIVGYTYVKI